MYGKNLAVRLDYIYIKNSTDEKQGHYNEHGHDDGYAYANGQGQDPSYVDHSYSQGQDTGSSPGYGYGFWYGKDQGHDYTGTGYDSNTGEIYLKYDVHADGHKEASGRVPDHGEWHLDSHTGQVIGHGELGRFHDVDHSLKLDIKVWDKDSDGKDDHLKNDLHVTYDQHDNYGIGSHAYETKDYCLYYSIYEYHPIY